MVDTIPDRDGDERETEWWIPDRDGDERETEW